MEFRKIIDGTVYSPIQIYPNGMITTTMEIETDGVRVETKVDVSFNKDNLSESSISLLKSLCFKEYLIDYEANHTYVEETYSEIISHIKREVPNPEIIFNSRQAVEELFPMFENEMLELSGDVSLVMNMIQFGGAFKSIAKKIEYMFQKNQISTAGYEYFLFVFNQQNIDLLSYLTLE